MCLLFKCDTYIVDVDTINNMIITSSIIIVITNNLIINCLLLPQDLFLHVRGNKSVLVSLQVSGVK